MKCNMPIKSVSPEIKRTNIIYKEVKSELSRLAIQSTDEDMLQDLIIDFIDSINDNLEILIKVHSGEYKDTDEIIWKHYYGECEKLKLKDILLKHHNTVFHDSNYQLLIRNKDNNDYICFDDHGILYFYLSKYDELLEKLKEYKLENNYSKFIMSKGHWHYRFKDAEDYLNKFINELELKLEK